MNLQNRLSQLEQNTLNYQNSFGQLTAEQLNFKPNAATWSVGQNIDHVIKINESYYPIFNAVKQGNYKTPFIAKVPFVANMLGKMILQSVEPERKRKIKTFPIWEPSESHIAGDILHQFEQHQQRLSEDIVALKPQFEEDVVISSPANRNIIYKLSTAIDIIITHEQRHYNQAVVVSGGW